MKTAFLILAAALAFGTAAAAQDHGHDHGAGHEEHAHDAAHFATAQHAEHRLTDTIAALQAGTPDYDGMVPELAEAVRTQSAAMTPALQSLGALQTLEHIGEPQPGVHQFRVAFASGQVTTWSIAINGEDKIAGLLIQ